MSSAIYKQDYENITDANIFAGNQYLNYENAKEVYKEIVTHGPLDVKLMIGNAHPIFNYDMDAVREYIGDPSFTDDLNLNYKFRGTSFCEGIKLYLGAQDLLTNEFAPNGDADKYYFDKCEAVEIEGMWFNVWSFSIEK